MKQSESESYRSEGDSIRIVAVCKEVVFRNDANGYTVADFSLQSERQHSFTGVGTMPFLDPGETVVLFGKWTDHPVYGRQFQVESFSPFRAASAADMIRYLSSGSIPWIGPKTAQKIVDRFGTDTLDVLRENPDRLSEIRGITIKKAQDISLAFRQKGDFQELSMLLTPFGFGAARIMSVYKRFGTYAPSIIRKNPYLLATEISGIGFLTADRVARSIGYDFDSPFRIGSAVLHLLTASESDGDTYTRMDYLLRRTALLLENISDSGTFGELEDKGRPYIDSSVESGLRSPSRTGQIRHSNGLPIPGSTAGSGIGEIEFLRGLQFILESAKIVVYRTDDMGIVEYDRVEKIDSALKVALPKTFDAEKTAANALITGQSSHAFQPACDGDRDAFQPACEGDKDEFADEGAILDKIKIISGTLSIELSEEQGEALLSAIRSPCSVITGGPGTGKTTIVAVLVRYYIEKGQRVVLCAPTGRAAKRLSEACDYTAGTIHRLLEVGHPDRTGADEAIFGRNEENPIEAEVVIVDETSMLDTILLAALLSALPKDCRTVFIGDKDQLPSVSAGNVLSDMIASGKVPSARLHTIYRQAQQSRIVRSAHAVLGGGEMVFDQSLDSDCMLVAKRSPEEIAEAVTRLYAHVLPEVYGMDPLREAVVLCPSRKGSAGIVNLNLLLQKEYGVLSDRFIQSGGFRFCIGDRVMQTRNDYDLSYVQADGDAGQGVFNGELGVVLSVDPHTRVLVVELDDRRVVRYDSEHMEDLEPAYAITVHKSQGSEFPVVILAIPGGPPMLYNRNLLYTAITRARKILFVVSDRRTLAMMIRNRSQAERSTSLKDFMEIYAREGNRIE